MKKFLLVATAALITVSSFAQSAYTFTTLKDNAHGDTEDQCATGTCWSFATISFFESEILRKTKQKVDLSEMYNVRINYPLKANSYVRYQGKQQFGPGGLSHDVLNVIREHGMMPEVAYSGLPAGQTEHDHGAMDIVLESITKSVIEKKLNEQNQDWRKAIEGVLDAYIGALPKEFTYDGKKYTAASFRDAMGINADDYVCLTSFTHHPYYSSFVVEVPDNWSKGAYYNLPLNEFQSTIDNALDKGFTIAWDADVSEKGFSFKNGLGILPADSVKKENYFKKIVTEKSVTAEARQAQYDSFATTDDHLMHITGKAKDQNGAVYYMTKNSWGSENPYGGYQYISTPYLQMKTVAIVIHKDALPAEIKAKLGIK
jgi:bleomycin hydrolase